MAYITEPRVLEVLDGDRAVVSTRGKRRVVIQPGGEVLAEFVSPSQARTMAGYFNRNHSGEAQAVVAPYARQSPRPLKSKRPARFRSAV